VLFPAHSPRRRWLSDWRWPSFRNGAFSRRCIHALHVN